MGPRLVPWIVLLAPACMTPEVEILQSRVTLVTPRGCDPVGEIERVRLESLGDFPAADARAADLSAREIATLENVPFEVELLSASVAGAEWEAAGTSPLPLEGARSLLVAPFFESCPLTGDFELATADGAAAVPLPDGSALIAGGFEEPGSSRGSRRLLRLPASGDLSEVLAASLPLGRVGATATASGDLVVIAGGSIVDDESPLDTFDVYDDRVRRLAAASVPLCPTESTACEGPRRDHGAGRLANGAVLLVGGTSGGGEGELLSSGIVLQPETGETRPVAGRFDDGELLSPLFQPSVVLLDNGETYVLGGRTVDGVWTGEMARFDSALFRFDRVIRLGARREPVTAIFPVGEAAIVPLPGHRVAHIRSNPTGPPLVAVVVLDEALLARRLDPVLRWPEGLTQLTVRAAVSLPDGRIVLHGATLGDPVAFVLDLGAGTATRLETTRATERLIAVQHGATFELGPEGGSFRRVSLRTPFDNPPTTLLPTDFDWLSYDSALRWDIRDDGAVPSRVGFVSVAGLELASFRVRIDVDSAAEVLLQPVSGAEAAAIRFLGDEVGIGLCETNHNGGALEVERRGEQVVLRVGAAEVVCAPPLRGRVRLEIRVQPGSTLRTIQLERR